MIVNHQEGPPEPVVIDMGWMQGDSCGGCVCCNCSGMPIFPDRAKGESRDNAGEDERASRAQGCEIGAG